MRRGYSTASPISSSLFKGTWDDGELVTRVVAGSSSIGRWVDDHWQRSIGATNEHWRWYEILREHPEQLALVLADKPTEVVSLWCSKRPRGLLLDGKRYYRLDYLELSPHHRGGVLGPLTMGLVAERALELNCEGIVLQSLPEERLVAWYTRLGGEERLANGWSRIGNLVPIVYEESAVRALAEKVNGIRN